MLGALQVVAEGLLDDDARPAVRGAPLPGLDEDRLDRIRRDGKVVDPVPGGAALVVEPGEALGDVLLSAGVGEVRGHVANPLRKLVPDVLAKLVARMVLDRLLHLLPEGVVTHLGAGNSDDAELWRQKVSDGEGVKRRKELALGQVPGGAEDREGAGLGCPAAAKPFFERVWRLGLDRRAHSLLTAWPPN